MKRTISLSFVCISLFLTGCVSSGAKRDVATEEAAQVNTQLAVEYFQRGDKETALLKIDKALEQNKQNPNAHMVKAMILASLEEYDDAEDHYEDAVDLAPNDPAVLNNYGTFLCNRGKYRKGIENFLEAARNQRYPHPESAWTNAGQCAERIPDIKRAEEYFRKALSVNQNYPRALWQMAELSFEQGNMLGARAFLQRLEPVQPLGAEALWLGVRIERRLNDKRAENRYESLLLRDHADSREAKLLMESQSER